MHHKNWVYFYLGGTTCHFLRVYNVFRLPYVFVETVDMLFLFINYQLHESAIGYFFKLAHLKRNICDADISRLRQSMFHWVTQQSGRHWWLSLRWSAPYIQKSHQLSQSRLPLIQSYMGKNTLQLDFIRAIFSILICKLIRSSALCFEYNIFLDVPRMNHCLARPTQVFSPRQRHAHNFPHRPLS